jgi:hypothetical protein
MGRSAADYDDCQYDGSESSGRGFPPRRIPSQPPPQQYRRENGDEQPPEVDPEKQQEGLCVMPKQEKNANTR